LQRRGGTENSAGIIGLSVAADLARAFLEDAGKLAHLTVLRDRFEASVLQSVPGSRVNGPTRPGAAMGLRLWNTSNIAFPGLEAEAILLGLSERGVCASAGAACSSGSLEPSPVLLAMGVPEPVAHGSVRFSLSRETTDDDIDRALRVLPEVVRRLGRVMPVA
jgi:cysteine desulfurase